MKKTFIIAILIIGIGFLGWQIYQKASVSGKEFKMQRRDLTVAVEIAPVQKTSIREIGQFTGSLLPLSEFKVAPKIAGRLEKILVNIGDIVKGAQLMAVLDDEEYHQQVNQAIAELEVAEANFEERDNALQNAKREYERTVALRQKKIASESELDTAKSEFNGQQAKLKVARAQVSQKKAALEMAKVRLSYTQIRVPENHAARLRVVGERYVDEGAMLAPNTPIVSILDIGTLIAVINVIERDYPKIKQGLEALISTDAFPGRTFRGRVIRIAPLLMEKSREARIEIEISNNQRLLKPGMFVRVQIEFEQHENVTVVPIAALVKRNGEQGVFEVDRSEKKAHFVPVELGIVNGTQAEILNPPLSDAVVTLGQHLLEDGGNIILPDETSGDRGPRKPGSTGTPQRRKPGTGEKK
ncbi:MAG: efflux RND transporter periplasmic adaptor subunit [Desulfobacterales bacterium]|jgi:RND family efflux transporter MFP subunit